MQNGPLTSRLQHLKVGDTVLIGKPTGTLVADNLLPGKTLWMLSTGTGLAPFMSIIRDPDIYDRFDKVILTHTCRLKGGAYMDYIKHDLPGHEYWATSSRKSSSTTRRSRAKRSTTKAGSPT